MRDRVEALVALGSLLRAAGYHFITPSPTTHTIVNGRAESRVGTTLRDVFGWSRPFAEGALPSEIVAAMREADVVEGIGDGLLKSHLRFSSLGEHLFAHSAFPTTEQDAVFFGPDTYRFCSAIERHAPPASRLVVDVGCGCGAGGLVAAKRAARVLLTDVNERALDLARVNARLADASGIEARRSDLLTAVDEAPDLVIANPPYMKDHAGRTYRDGGGSHGEELAARIVRAALSKLAPGGTLILYTGAAIVDGVDVFRRAITPLLDAAVEFTYREIDPDVFGEELALPAYARVERIAAVVLVLRVGSNH